MQSIYPCLSSRSNSLASSESNTSSGPTGATSPAHPIGQVRTHAGTPGALVELTTAGIPAAQRLDFWHEAHMGRMALSRAAREDEHSRPFEGHVRRVLGLDSHLMMHGSDTVVAVRSRAQCRRDGVDYISINLMLECGPALMDHGGQQRLRAGSLYFVDSAQPVEFRHPRHQSVSIFLPRRKVQEAAGNSAKGAPLRLPPSLQAHSGLAAVLRSHMRMAAVQAPFMTAPQRVMTVTACAEMALALVQEAAQGAANTDQFALASFEAARRIVLQKCGDPQLDPAAVATALGCSRATLYRLFLRHGQSVAALIWTARLTRAHDMIASGRHALLSLSDIALQSGFVDQAGFNRMFKRRYGLTPGEVREQAAAPR